MPSIRPFSTPSTGNWGHTPYAFLHQPTLSCRQSGPSPPPSTGNCGHTPYAFLPQPIRSCHPSGPSPPPSTGNSGHTPYPFLPQLTQSSVHQVLLHPLYWYCSLRAYTIALPTPAFSVMPSVRPFSTPFTGNWGHTPRKMTDPDPGCPKTNEF
jgi:hypothetical protein